MTSQAHTEAIGYVVVSPGNVDVWFGTYHDFTESPQTEGHALLTLPDTTQISVPFTLTSATVPNGLHEGTNLLINTAEGFTLADMNSWQGAPFTGLTQIGTYTVVLDPAFPPQSQKWFIDFSDPISFTINPNVSGLLVPNSGLTPNQSGVVNSINQAIAAGNASPAFNRVTLALMTAAAAGNSVLGADAEQLSPLNFNHFASTTAFNNETFETQAEDSYLAGQRTGEHGTFASGNGTLDASGLVVNDPNYDPGLTVIHSRMMAWNTAPGSIIDSASPFLGGVDMKDTKSMREAAYNPWNAFIRGNVILGEGLEQADQSHFDNTTTSVVVGADYRLSRTFLVGATLGYGHSDVDLDNSNSSATVDSYSPGLYAAWADKGWYANLQGRYTYNSYTQDRHIGFLDQTASSGTDGNQGVVNLDGGYDFHHGALTYGPSFGLQYTHLTVNSYGEAGSDVNLAVAQDQSDSLRSRLGGQIRYAFAGCGGTEFTPHLQAWWMHEFMDQSRGITSQFANFGGGDFTVRTQDSSSNFVLIDLGLDAKVNNRITVFGDYMVQAGQEDYTGQSLQAGVKVNF